MKVSMRDRRPSIAILQSFLILYRMYNTSYNEKIVYAFYKDSVKIVENALL